MKGEVGPGVCGWASSPLLARLAAAVALALGAGCGSRPPAPILAWHSVAPDGAPLPEGEAAAWTVTASQFAAQLDALRSAGARVVPLAEVCRAAAEGVPLPPRSVALTFDDGTADLVRTALPALSERRLHATFFLVPGLITRPPARRRLLEEGGAAREVLSWDEAALLVASGMAIGSHSMTHLRLPGAEAQAVRDEVVWSKASLQNHLGIAVELFAYPYNAVRLDTVQAVREAGYRCAVAGVVHGDGRPFTLRREPVKRTTRPEELVALLR